MHCVATNWMNSDGRNAKRSFKRVSTIECYKEKIEGKTKIKCRIERSGPELQIIELDIESAKNLRAALDREIEAAGQNP